MLLKTKIKIENWLNKYDIINYKLIKDDNFGYIVNVNGNVNLWNRQLKTIDVKFNIVKGSFNCSYNELTSLENSPEIVGKNFFCGNNILKTLDSCPETIKGNLYCSNNNLNIDGVIHLINREIKSNCIELYNNIELSELQNMNDFKKVKKILTIYQEKKELNSLIENNKTKISINKI